MSARPHLDIEACVFDAYGTLFDVAAAARAWEGVLGPQTEPLTRLWRTKQLEYSWLRSLMGRHEDFWHVTGSALDFAMESLGLDDAALRARLMESYLTLGAYDDARDCLERVKASGRKTAILSNGSPSMLAGAVSAAGLGALLDAVLSIEAVGTYKPHPTVYAMVGQRFGVEPQRVCFVSANGWDVAGASVFGFRAVWINRTGARAEKLPGEAVATVETLARIPELVGA